ncbi:MAG: hypothetical protein QOK19_467 [Solirubrobacteraceae bacterium]|jgi:hypothetical protein|nr:hypothetical protein [Solirubrobacterales bacterium]MEA2214906.1 hypothetical protein [Solirubrobacteraceae bacterium]
MPGASKTVRRLAIACAMLVLAWFLARGVSAPVVQALAYLLPAIGLLGFLCARRYPGEPALLAAIAARRPRRPKPASTGGSGRGVVRALVPRGGRLLSCSLAVRPPPEAAVPSI